MKQQFKSNSRSKFKRNISRLEASFDVDYIMYHGAITKDEFDLVFAHFYTLLEKRYTEKGEPCGELDPTLWNYYCDLAFAMIQEKTASLFVIYCNAHPIGITFSYHDNTTLIEALTVFDIDYYRFNIGHTTIYKMLEWSFNNGIELFDYTQGNFEYKKRWSNTTYDTTFHILYDAKSIKSGIVANLLATYFNLKRNVRDRNLNKVYHNFKHRVFGDAKPSKSLYKTLNIEIVSDPLPNQNELELINLNDQLYTSHRRAIYDFLYMHPEPAKYLKVYYHKKSNIFYASGKFQILKIVEDEK
jgi:CelD/BcsL family acetyltransferase involved in cellulose biosynthesis